MDRGSIIADICITNLTSEWQLCYFVFLWTVLLILTLADQYGTSITVRYFSTLALFPLLLGTVKLIFRSVMSVRPSAWPHGTIRFSLEGFS